MSSSLDNFELEDNCFFLKSYSSNFYINLKVINKVADMEELNPTILKELYPNLKYNPNEGSLTGNVDKIEVNYFDSLNYLGTHPSLKKMSELSIFELHLNDNFDPRGSMIKPAKNASTINPLYDFVSKKYIELLKEMKLIVDSFTKYKGYKGLLYKDSPLAKTLEGDFKAFSSNIETLTTTKATNLNTKYDIIEGVLLSAHKVLSHFKNTLYKYDLLLNESKIYKIEVQRSVKIKDLKFVGLNATLGISGVSNNIIYLSNSKLHTIIGGSRTTYIFDNVTFEGDDRIAYFNGVHDIVFARNTLFNTSDKNDLECKALILGDKVTYNSISKEILSKFKTINQITDPIDYIFDVDIKSIKPTIQAYANAYLNGIAQNFTRAILYITESPAELLGHKMISGNQKYKDINPDMIALLAGLLAK